ncbi:MAG: hypothetical protein AAF667_08730 [Pseudomonadota bacterium]
MPLAVIAILGGAIGLALLLGGRITGRQITTVGFAAAGAALAVMTLRGLSLISGPIGLAISAFVGAVLMLWVMRQTRGED